MSTVNFSVPVTALKLLNSSLPFMCSHHRSIRLRNLIYALTKLTTHLLLYSQEFCRRNLIPHIVVLSDKELFFERKQVRLRTLEPTGKSSEKTLAVSELPEFLLQQRHGPERGDSLEAQSSARIGGGPSNLDPFPSNARPPVNVTVLATSKLSGHFKRKIHDAVSLSLSLPSPLSSSFSCEKFQSVCVFADTD